MKYKILFLTKSFGVGGRETQMVSLIRAVKRYYPEIDISLAIFNKCTHDILGLDSNQINLIQYPLYNPLNLKDAIQIKKLLRLEKYSFILAIDEYVVPLAIYISLFSNIKFINGSLRHGKVNYFHKRQLFRNAFYRFSKYIIANSREGFKANKLLFNKNKFVLYNGIDSRFLNFERTYNNDSNLVLLSVSRLHPIKDFITVFNAIAILHHKGIKDIKYYIVGDGVEKNKLQHYVSKTGIKDYVHFVGNQSDVMSYYKTADIFIHSSKSEGCPNVVLEAMSNGLPVIATDTGGTKEIVNSSNGILFKFKNERMLSKKIELLLNNKDLRQNLGETARNYVLKNHSYQALANNFVNILNKINER